MVILVGSGDEDGEPLTLPVNMNHCPPDDGGSTDRRLRSILPKVYQMQDPRRQGLLTAATASQSRSRTNPAATSNRRRILGVAGSPNRVAVRAVNGYATPWNQPQHVNYVDASGFINELYYDGKAWSHRNLTVLAPGAEQSKYVSRGVAIASYATEWNKQQHIMYIDVNGHINELYYTD
jgi:hypothetical protein